MFGDGLVNVTLGEARWRMLGQGLALEVFTYHNVRAPGRASVKNFDALLDLGLIERAPDGAAAVARAAKLGIAAAPAPGGVFLSLDAVQQILDRLSGGNQ